MQRDYQLGIMTNNTTNHNNDSCADARISAEEAELVLVHRRQRLEEQADRLDGPHEPASVPAPLLQPEAASPQALFEAISTAAARARNERLSLVRNRDSNNGDDGDDDSESSLDLAELLDSLRDDIRTGAGAPPAMQASSTISSLNADSIPSNIDCNASTTECLPSLEESAWWTSKPRASLLNKSYHGSSYAAAGASGEKHRQLSLQQPSAEDQARLEALFGGMNLTTMSDHSERKQSLKVADLYDEQERNWTRRRAEDEEDETEEHEEDDFFQSSMELSLDQSQFMRQLEHPQQQPPPQRRATTPRGKGAKTLDDSAATASTYCSDMSWSGWGSAVRPIPEHNPVYHHDDANVRVVREQPQH